jgi:hypothetical protein
LPYFRKYSQPLRFSKTPFEIIAVTIDFSEALGSDPPEFDAVVAVNSITGVDTTAVVISQNPAPAIPEGTNSVAFLVMGGSGGDVHNIGVRILDTVTGAQFEKPVQLTITPWP